MHIFVSREHIKACIENGEHFLVGKPDDMQCVHPVIPSNESGLQNDKLITLCLSTSPLTESTNTCLEPKIFLLVDQNSEQIIRCISILPDDMTIIIYSRNDIKSSIIVQAKPHSLVESENDELLVKAGRFSSEDENPTRNSATIFVGLCQLQLKALSVISHPLAVTESSLSAAAELINRRRDLCTITCNKETSSEQNNSGHQCLGQKNLRCWISIFQSSVNLLLGVVIMILLFLYGSLLSEWLIVNTEAVIRRMIWLLDWLMGVPAGLKLNSRLTVFLGRFFMYHVWLWAEYLKLIGVYFTSIVKLIGCIGMVGGASLQIALFQDMITLFTLHLYCFYIYSARLYSMSLYSLLSLWRLFRGLKWNNLRQRVDHASYDSTQLFIGTLLFSIILFTLPTVILYYVVFGTLRMSILIIQWTLDTARSHITHRYMLVNILRLFNSNLVKAEYSLSVSPASCDNITVIEISQLKVASYQQICSVLELPVKERSIQIGNYIRYFFKGHIF